MLVLFVTVKLPLIAHGAGLNDLRLIVRADARAVVRHGVVTDAVEHEHRDAEHKRDADDDAHDRQQDARAPAHARFFPAVLTFPVFFWLL